MSKASAIDLSYQQRPLNQKLDHIPGDHGWPYFGVIFEMLSDPYGLMERLHGKYGPVASIRIVGEKCLVCSGAEVNRQIYLDQNGTFSPMMGYAESLSEFYGGGLLMRDFDNHRMHRRIFQSAFKNESMLHYTDIVNQVIEENILGWEDKPDFHFFPHIKTTLLDVAAQIFLGINDFKGDEAQRISESFITIAEGMLGLLRWDSPLVPMVKWRRGKEARRFMEDSLRRQIGERRQSDRRDIFSMVCREKDEHGNYFSDEDITAHINFLLFAAHDTTTSNLSYIMQHLGQDSALQERARRQSIDRNKAFLVFDDLVDMTELEKIHLETLRMHPSVMMMNRRTIRDCVIEGVQVPADTRINIFPQYTHMLEEHWDEPKKFDPERFSPERAEHKRHPFQFIPFGGGAHKCIGMHFAGMIVKCFLHQMLLNYSWTTLPGYNPAHQAYPMPKQKDDLPLKLVRR